MSDSIKYVRMEDCYLPDLQMLFAKIFRRKVTIEYLQNKYDTGYLGIKYLCCMAFDQKKAIAFYGAIPQKFTRGNESILVAHACDSLTLEEYRRKGLHYNLARMSYEIMRSAGVKFVYAFHSENTYWSTRKLNCKEGIHMQRNHLRVNMVPFAKAWRKIFLEKFYQKYVIRILQPYSTNFKIGVPPEKFQQDYNPNFLDYKSNFTGIHCLNLEDCQFIIKIESIMKVGFFVAPTIQQFRIALDKLKHIAFILGVNEILFQVSPNSTCGQMLDNVLESKQSWLVGYFSFDKRFDDLSQFDFNYLDLDTF